MQLHVCILSMFFPIFKDKSKLSALKNLKFQILWTFSMSEKVSKPHSFQCTLQPLISDVSCFYDVINSYRCIFLQLDPFWCWLKSTLIFIWKCPVSYDFSFSWSQSWLKCLTTGQQTMGTVIGLTDRWLVCLNTLSKVAHVFKRPHNASTTLYFLLPFFFSVSLWKLTHFLSMWDSSNILQVYVCITVVRTAVSFWKSIPVAFQLWTFFYITFKDRRNLHYSLSFTKKHITGVVKI